MRGRGLGRQTEKGLQVPLYGVCISDFNSDHQAGVGAGVDQGGRLCSKRSGNFEVRPHRCRAAAGIQPQARQARSQRCALGSLGGSTACRSGARASGKSAAGCGQWHSRGGAKNRRWNWCNSMRRKVNRGSTSLRRLLAVWRSVPPGQPTYRGTAHALHEWAGGL